MKLKLACSDLNVHRLRFEEVPREKRCGQHVCMDMSNGRWKALCISMVLHCRSYATI